MSDRDAILSARLRAARGGHPVPLPVMAPVAASPVPAPKVYLRVAEAAEELGVHPRTLAGWEKEGLRICRVDRIAIIRRADLDDFLLRHAGGNAEEKAVCHGG
jgi:hypothetical protein